MGTGSEQDVLISSPSIPLLGRASLKEWAEYAGKENTTIGTQTLYKFPGIIAKRHGFANKKGDSQLNKDRKFVPIQNDALHYTLREETDIIIWRYNSA
jgi:hypothetical protein